MDNDNQIRDRINKLVLLSGLTKPKFAEKIGFNKANLNLILKGERKVPESLVFAIISNKLSSFEYLVNGVEDSKQGTNKILSDISSGGDTTIHNGESEAQSKRSDDITNKMLDMLSKSFDGVSDVHAKLISLSTIERTHMTAIEQRLDERNKLADRLMSMLESKDEQLKEKDNQINKLLNLLSEKKKE